MKPRISAVVITKNEEDRIKACLDSLSFLSDIVVVDDLSLDETCNISKKMKARVFKRPLKNDFASQRNYGLKQAKGEWVLFVDADEKITEELKSEILKSVQSEYYSGFYLKRQDYFLGKKLNYGETANLKLLRLARKTSGKWKRPVHEYWDINGRIGNLIRPLIHCPHPTISEFIEEVNYYTQVEANYRKSRGESVSFTSSLAYPAAKFIKNYIFYLGFLDGFPGFVIAYLMSLHSLMLRIKIRT